ncbi:MAG: branched-chain amino acid ABC transporter permease [Alphaproteobacteria bacterium]|uniref:Branched-chain amino acid ABC transporter permease n=1 Tax=Futiania mangrovi TaxID=2959716 RepID=A0A9J6PGK0_9PROT|nr:branched-chain amino acid ABC transporter permease [Futiania mangrovii]MCP1336952.1 branched-chain amino acid ABC transporter permease [Futiania mangrovii]MDX5360012.1 branched-chain amino acid ABC transporter permease [Alphaproteobacteria bacterium]MDX5368100.1 branched-chain amino acid ABC transporter permease [Alphaproteobacteria bacterium]MDX5462939.1 branched-chain amino acid ABC transporter permease [Alphaproteobacteria bacterium]
MEVLQLLVGGISNGCIYGLVALGFVLIYKASEAVNFAQGDFMMLGAFLAISFVNAEGADLPFLLGIVCAGAVMGVFGYLLDRFVLRGIFGQPQFAMVILTIALGFVLRFVAGVIWGHDPVSLQTSFAGQQVEVAGVIIAWADVWTIAATMLLTGVLWLFFARTKLGVAMQASSQNQMAAYYMGIPVKTVNSVVWGLSGVVSAVAGAMFAAKGAIDPSVGLLGIKAFAAAVIGGFGSLPGALLGGLLIGIVEPFAARFAPAGTAQVAPYAIMLVVLITRPHGLFAQVRQKKV